jgi:hypothetical protein
LPTGQNLATRKFLLFTNPQQTRRGIAEVIEHLEGFQVRNPIDKEIPGIVQLVEKAEVRIRNGLVAYDALEKLKANRGDDAARASFNASSKDLGYGLLLKQFVEDPRLANDQQIKDAAWSVGRRRLGCSSLSASWWSALSRCLQCSRSRSGTRREEEAPR